MDRTGADEGPLAGIVLAAGEGTRLRPLTAWRPKPLVPVAGAMLVEYALDALARLGVRTVGLNTHHLGVQVPPALAHRPERLVFVDEPALLGTGGGVRGVAAQLPRGTLVVINGDALFDFDIAPILAAHRARGAMGTLALREVEPAAPFGRVAVDAESRVHRIAEVRGPRADDPELREGAFTGVQIMEPELWAALPDGPSDVLRTAWRDQIMVEGPVYGEFVPSDSAWLDVGTPGRYLAAHEAALSGALRRLPAAASAHIERGAAWMSARGLGGARLGLDPGVIIGSGVSLEGIVSLGAGAVIADGAALSDCVVWPGAVVSGVAHREVVLPGGVRAPLADPPETTEGPANPFRIGPRSP